LQAPHAGDDERSIRNLPANRFDTDKRGRQLKIGQLAFRVPDGEVIEFVDGYSGNSGLSGEGFGISWCGGTMGPSYQLAVVADDAAMQITEVVRGRICSFPRRGNYCCIARWICNGQRLSLSIGHNQAGLRLAKRDAAMSLRASVGRE